MNELGRISFLIGEALRANPAVWTAQPGGGPNTKVSIALDNPGLFATAVKPQYGSASPDARLTVDANSPTALPVRTPDRPILKNNSGATSLVQQTNTVQVVPAQATIVGYYDTGTVSTSEVADAQILDQPQPAYQVFSGGKVVNGARNAPWAQNPTTRVANEVKALRATLIQSINEARAAYSSGFTYEIYQIDYAGVVWGYKGYHFPA